MVKSDDGKSQCTNKNISAVPAAIRRADAKSPDKIFFFTIMFVLKFLIDYSDSKNKDLLIVSTNRNLRFTNRFVHSFNGQAQID